MEISKKDWKLFREKIPVWQEAYMTRLCDEYRRILDSDALASERFWKLEQRINNDKHGSGVILSLRKSDMILSIVALVNDEVITIDDLSEFSDDVISSVKLFAQGNFWQND